MGFALTGLKQMSPISCLAVSGSLRQGSSNTSVLETAATLAPDGMTITIYKSIDELPHFNPDLDGARFQTVTAWLTSIRDADGLIVSTPEYAHNIPGSFKNALDWLVGSDAFIYKPFMILNTSPRSTYAHESLVEILSTMSGVHVKTATMTIPLIGKSPREISVLIQEQYSGQIRTSLELFARAIRDHPREKDHLFAS